MVGRIPEYFPENKGAKIVGRPVIPEIAPPLIGAILSTA